MHEIPIVRLAYHEDEQTGTWWADSPDLDGFSAAGDSFEGVRTQAREGVEFFVGKAVAVIEDGLPSKAPGGVVSVARIRLEVGTFTGSVVENAGPLTVTYTDLVVVDSEPIERRVPLTLPGQVVSAVG